MKKSEQLLLLLSMLFIFGGCAHSGGAVRPSYRDKGSNSHGRYSAGKRVVARADDLKQSTPEHEDGAKASSNAVNNTDVAKSGEDQASQKPVVKIEDKAARYIGVRYKYGGTTRKGFDCSGYVWRVYQDMGFDFSRSSSQVYYSSGKKISRKEARKGDLVFFKDRGRINHVGIFLGGDRFIHASSSRGVIESSLQNTYWKPRIAGFRRYYN